MTRENRHTVAVPLIGTSKDAADIYLEKVIKMGADSVFLMTPLDNICRSLIPVKRSECSDDILAPVPDQRLCDVPSLELISHWADVFCAIAPKYEKHGIKPYYWFCHSIGHGGELSTDEGAPYQRITGPEGNHPKGCFCPLDKDFREYMLSAFRIIAKTKVELILIDDDFRLNYHMPGAVFGCFCPAHIQRFNAIYGLNLTREEIVQHFFEDSGDIRNKWIQASGSSLLNFAAEIEKAVHSVSPETRIGLATAMTHWSSEGFDVIDMAKALAGNTRPYIRTFGAPYHAKETLNSLGFTIENSRFQREHLLSADIEVICEGDTYPHTRFFTSNKVFKAYMNGMRAWGFKNILNYSFPFSATADFESGYCDTTHSLIKHRELLDKMLCGALIARGVNPVISFNNLSNCKLTADMSAREMGWAGEPVVLKALSRLGIPASAEDSMSPVFITGYNGISLSDEEINKRLDKGAIIDAAAADWLVSRGFDIGIKAITRLDFSPAFELYTNEKFSPKHKNENIWLLTQTNGFYRLACHDTCQVLSLLCDGTSDKKSPAAVIYENNAGRRIMVLAFDFYQVRNGFQTVYNYARGEQLKSALNWISRNKTPYVIGGPDIHCLFYNTADYKEMIVCLHNLSNDPFINPTIHTGGFLPDKNGIRYLNNQDEQTSTLEGYEIINDGQIRYIKLHTVVESGELFIMRFHGE